MIAADRYTSLWCLFLDALFKKYTSLLHGRDISKSSAQGKFVINNTSTSPDYSAELFYQITSPRLISAQSNDTESSSQIFLQCFTWLLNQPIKLLSVFNCRPKQLFAQTLHILSK